MYFDGAHPELIGLSAFKHSRHLETILNAGGIPDRDTLDALSRRVEDVLFTWYRVRTAALDHYLGSERFRRLGLHLLQAMDLLAACSPSEREHVVRLLRPELADYELTTFVIGEARKRLSEELAATKPARGRPREISGIARASASVYQAWREFAQLDGGPRALKRSLRVFIKELTEGMSYPTGYYSLDENDQRQYVRELLPEEVGERLISLTAKLVTLDRGGRAGDT